MVLEIDLHYLVAESKHYSMSCAHPLFDVNGASRRLERVLAIVGISQSQFHLSVLVTGALLGC